MARMMTRIRACYGCYYGWYHGMTMVAAMVDTMGLLWLIPWDCYDWYHEIAMIAAMIVAIVDVMMLEIDEG